MTASLTSVRFIAPAVPPIITAADVALDYPAFCKEFPQSIVRRLWVRVMFGSSRGSRVAARITNASGRSELAVCDLSWTSGGCYAQIYVDPFRFKIEPGAQIEILKQMWSMRRNAEPCAAPNGGPATPVGNSGVTEGPPSVS